MYTKPYKILFLWSSTFHDHNLFAIALHVSESSAISLLLALSLTTQIIGAF